VFAKNEVPHVWFSTDIGKFITWTNLVSNRHRRLHYHPISKWCNLHWLVGWLQMLDFITIHRKKFQCGWEISILTIPFVVSTWGEFLPLYDGISKICWNC